GWRPPTRGRSRAGRRAGTSVAEEVPGALHSFPRGDDEAGGGQRRRGDLCEIEDGLDVDSVGRGDDDGDASRESPAPAPAPAAAAAASLTLLPHEADGPSRSHPQARDRGDLGRGNEQGLPGRDRLAVNLREIRGGWSALHA